MDNFTETQLGYLLQILKVLSNCKISIEDIQPQITSFIGTIAYPNLGFKNPSITTEQDLARFKETAKLVMSAINKGVDANRSAESKTQDGLAKIQKFREKYPFYVDIKASKKQLDFIDKLQKEEYTQSEASIFLGISRQTLGKYVKESSHGFKFNRKQKKVTKEQLFNYYSKFLLTKQGLK